MTDYTAKSGVFHPTVVAIVAADIVTKYVAHTMLVPNTFRATS